MELPEPSFTGQFSTFDPEELECDTQARAIGDETETWKVELEQQQLLHS
jgi:hypothetical protein